MTALRDPLIILAGLFFVMWWIRADVRRLDRLDSRPTRRDIRDRSERTISSLPWGASEDFAVPSEGAAPVMFDPQNTITKRRWER